MTRDHDQNAPDGLHGQTAATDGLDAGAGGAADLDAEAVGTAADLMAGLTPKQEQAIIALLNQPTVKQAAASANVGQRTMYNWLHEPRFAAAYRRARRESFSHAISLTQRYSALAINTLARVMTDKKASDSAKVQAACAMLKFSRDSIELDDLASRLEALEAAAKAVGSRGGLAR